MLAGKLKSSCFYLLAKTNAIGLKASAERYGGTYAHQDISMWISAEFKIYLIREFKLNLPRPPFMTGNIYFYASLCREKIRELSSCEIYEYKDFIGSNQCKRVYRHRVEARIE